MYPISFFRAVIINLELFPRHRYSFVQGFGKSAEFSRIHHIGRIIKGIFYTESFRFLIYFKKRKKDEKKYS